MDGRKQMKKIILASGSPRRRELLTQIGISFEVVKAEGEEKITTDDPEEAVKELAMQKEYLIETRAVADEKGTLLNLKYYLIEENQRIRKMRFG